VIPKTPAEVTGDFLASALDTEIREVRVTPIGTGQTGATYRVSVTYARREDLPDTFVAVRGRVALGYRSEVEFYSGVAETLQLPVPRCYYSDISDDAAEYAGGAATTERGDEMVLTMLERGCRAIRELGTIDLVRQLSTPPSSKSTPGL
jgi:hypothetical protein